MSNELTEISSSDSRGEMILDTYDGDWQWIVIFKNPHRDGAVDWWGRNKSVSGDMSRDQVVGEFRSFLGDAEIVDVAAIPDDYRGPIWETYPRYRLDRPVPDPSELDQDHIYLAYDQTPNGAHTRVSVIRAERHDETLPDLNKWAHRSLFSYPRHGMRGHLESTGGTSGYDDGQAYTAHCVVIDIDHQALAIAQVQARAVSRYLESIGARHRVHWSGSKGYHIEIHRSDIGYGYHRDTADRMRAFVRSIRDRVHDVTGIMITVDWQIYTRGHKYRLPGCPRSNGSRKSQLPHRLLHEYEYAHHKVWASDPDRRHRGAWSPATEPNEVLRDLWDSLEISEGPVELLRPVGSYDQWTNIEGLDQLIRDQNPRASLTTAHTRDGEAEIIQISCPSPHHEDRSPSAGYFVGSGGVNCFKCGYFSPRQVAGWHGYTLEQEEENTLHESRGSLMTQLEDAVINGTGPIMATVPVGVGKSFAAMDISTRHNLSLIYLGDNHRLTSEQYEDYLQHGHGGDWLGRWYEVEPDCETEEIGPLAADYFEIPEEGGHRNSRADAMRYLESLGEPKNVICSGCRRNPHGQNFDETLPPCAFIQTRSEIFNGTEQEVAGETEGDREVIKVKGTAFAAKAYLRLPDALTRLVEGRDLVVIDEDAMSDLLTVESYPVSELRDLLQARMPIQIRGVEEPIELGQLIRDAVERGTLPLPPDVGRYGSVVDDGGGGGPSSRARITLDDLVDDDGYLGLSTDLGLSETGTRLLNHLRRKAQHSLQRVTHEGTEYVVVRSVVVLPEGPRYVFLDASFSGYDQHILSQCVPGDLEVIEIDARNTGTQIIHDPSSSWSRSAQVRYLGRHDNEDDEDLDRYGRLRAFVQRHLNKRIEIVDPETGEVVGERPATVGIISHGSSFTDELGLTQYRVGPMIQRLFDEVSGLDLHRHFVNFGGLRGRNHLRSVDYLIIIGDPALSGMAFVEEAVRFGVDPSAVVEWREGYTSRDSSYRLRYPMTCPVDDPIAQYIYDRLIRRELYQAIGRARGISHDCIIYALCAPDFRHREHHYRVNPRLLSDQSALVIDSVERAQLWHRVNRGWESLREISRDTGIHRKTLKEMQMRPLRARRLEAVAALDLEGKGVGDIAKLISCSPKTVRRMKKEIG